MKLALREQILIALFAALTAIGAFIQIPTPLVPFTLQYLFCAYSGVMLGAKKGLYAQLLYVGIGLIGIPIFTKGGGPSYVLQPTFGYLLGFIACAYVVGLLTERQEKLRLGPTMLALLAGLTVLYAAGVLYLYGIVNFYLGKSMSMQGALAAGFLPYITADLILSVLIAVTSIKVMPVLRRSGLVPAAFSKSA